ncbi:helix-turn-helix domain-containing protein [Kyrpidia sp.]|uniref:IS66 family insertion sequence element accessory protein TnpA n=1 Tax=Kyrpidia sp. TaxID=2073077 RepID=UPI002590D879|nr:helix-turn-helix domain-containing protein [Kyrpidia sp.]
MTKAELAELRELWRTRVADFRASGQTGAAWCAAHQIKEHQLWYWVSKFKTEAPPQSQPHFISIRVQDAPEGSEMALSVRVGPAIIEVRPGYDSDLLRDVVRTLASLC